MPESLPQAITVRYDESRSREYLPVTGAQGGPAPDGLSVVVHLYADFPSLPTTQRHKVGVGGVIDLSRGESQKSSDLTRQILATVVLPPESAVTIGKWLAEKGEQAKAIREQTKEVGTKEPIPGETK